MAAVLECAAGPLDPDSHAEDSAGLAYATGPINIRSDTQDQVQTFVQPVPAKECLHALTNEGDRGAVELESRAADVDHWLTAFRSWP